MMRAPNMVYALIDNDPTLAQRTHPRAHTSTAHTAGARGTDKNLRQPGLEEFRSKIPTSALVPTNILPKEMLEEVFYAHKKFEAGEFPR